MFAMQMTTVAVVCFTDLNLNSKVKVVNYMIIFKSLCTTFLGKQHFGIGWMMNHNCQDPKTK